MSRSWFTKKIKKKKRNETEKEKRISPVTYLIIVHDSERRIVIVTIVLIAVYDKKQGL
jgi:hypothetical protein